MMIKLVLDAQEVETKADELLIDLLLRKEFKIPFSSAKPVSSPT
jgi:hypothetical protein